MGINDGTKNSMAFHHSRPLRTYRLKGVLGQVTDNMYLDGKIVQKASYDHVKHHHLDKVLATLQASHQKLMFQLVVCKNNTPDIISIFQAEWR